MLPINLLTLAALAAASSAPAGHEWQAPGPGDVRSPCPGINSLANHGYLPRSGKGITVASAITALKEGLNVGADFASAAALLGLQSTADPATATSFDLDNVDEHNFPIEHDGSLSRNDAYFGNDHSFDQSIFNQILAYYNGKEYTSIDVQTHARYHRIQNARARNPTFIYGPRQLALSYGESALFMSVMGDPVTAAAPLSYVRMFFEQEKLPYELGWSPPLLETNFATLGVLIAAMGAANPDIIPEGLTLGEGTYRDVFQLINPLTGKLENSTCIKAGTC